MGFGIAMVGGGCFLAVVGLLALALCRTAARADATVDAWRRRPSADARQSLVDRATTPVAGRDADRPPFPGHRSA